METVPRPLLGSSLLACVIALGMLGWVAYGNFREDQAVRDSPYRAVRGVQSEAEARQLDALLQEAYGVLRSGEFEGALRGLSERYPAIYLNPREQAGSAGRVADLVALKPLGARYVPADVGLSEGHIVDGWALGSTAEGPGEGRYSDIVLGRYVLGNWLSADAVRRSCAINVAAHEYAHTISLTPFVYRVAFTDTRGGETGINRRDRSAPVASYLIGTLAQCVWLQQRGRISRSELPACVEVFGVASGNEQRCGRFANGERVVPRPDLPPLNPPL